MRAIWWVSLALIWLGACSPPPQGENLVGAPTPIGTPVFAPTETELPTAVVATLTPEPFVRDTFFLESTELRSLTDQPGLVFLYVKGQLPTSCHQFSSAVCPTCAKNAPNQIQVNVYSLIETGKTCTGPTVPLEREIPLGVFTEGIYVVQLNGQYVGEFDAATFGNEVQMTRGTVFLETISLISPASAQEQAKLIVQGYLPTPCNVFKSDVSSPNEKGEILIDAYSLVPTGEPCIDVIQDFTSEILVGALPTGSYSVWVNGEQVGGLIVP